MAAKAKKKPKKGKSLEDFSVSELQLMSERIAELLKEKKNDAPAEKPGEFMVGHLDDKANPLMELDELNRLRNYIFDFYPQLDEKNSNKADFREFIKCLCANTLAYVGINRCEHKWTSDSLFSYAIIKKIMDNHIEDENVKDAYDRAVKKIGYRALSQSSLRSLTFSDTYAPFTEYFDRTEEVSFVFPTLIALLSRGRTHISQNEIDLAKKKASIFYVDKSTKTDRENVKRYILQVLAAVLGACIYKAFNDKDSPFKNLYEVSAEGEKSMTDFIIQVDELITFYVEKAIGGLSDDFITKYFIEVDKLVQRKLRGIEKPENYEIGLLSLSLEEPEFAFKFMPFTYIVLSIQYDGSDDFIKGAQKSLHGVEYFVPNRTDEIMISAKRGKPKLDLSYFDNVVKGLSSNEPVFRSNEFTDDGIPLRGNIRVSDLLMFLGVESPDIDMWEQMKKEIGGTSLWMPDDYVNFNYALMYALGARSVFDGHRYDEEFYLNKAGEKNNFREEMAPAPITLSKSEREKLESRILSLEKQLRASSKEYEAKIRSLEVEKKKLIIEVSDFENEREELSILREIIWENDNKEENYEYSADPVYPYSIEDKHIAIFGGPDTLQQALDKYVPGCVCYGANRQITEDMIRGNDLTVIITTYIAHSTMYKIVSTLKRTEEKYVVTTRSGIKHIAGEIVRALGEIA